MKWFFDCIQCHGTIDGNFSGIFFLFEKPVSTTYWIPMDQAQDQHNRLPAALVISQYYCLTGDGYCYNQNNTKPKYIVILVESFTYSFNVI